MSTFVFVIIPSTFQILSFMDKTTFKLRKLEAKIFNVRVIGRGSIFDKAKKLQFEIFVKITDVAELNSEKSYHFAGNTYVCVAKK